MVVNINEKAVSFLLFTKMDSRVAHSQVHENDEQHPHNVDSQQEEQHTDHEKKSSPIMNRMKAKAKKIKNTITKHGGNGNNNEHQHTPDDGDLDEDKEMVEDPEVYETPIYDSEVVKSATPASEKVENSGKSGSDDHMKDIRPVQESFERMNVHDELKPTTEPKIQSTVADTEYPPTGSHDQFVPHPSAATKTHNEYPQEIPSTKEKTFNTTDEIEISPATADGTYSPENDEASKLGYHAKGDRNGDKVKTNDERQESENGSTMSGRTVAYGKNIANSLTEKLAPVYGKVAEVGSAVKSKVYGTSTGGVETETKNGVKYQGKGVPVKGFLAEKLKPGEEDKALSEVISEALHKRKEEPVKKGDGDLSNGDEKTGKACEESHVNSPGKGVVGKVKDVVGSWLAKSGENQSPQVAGGEDLSKNKDYVAEGERVSQVVDK